MINVYTAGTWDLFHQGHLNILKKSLDYGDTLIVGVSTDELVMKYKRAKPVFEYKHRVELLQSCVYVDNTVKQTSIIPIRILKRYDIDVITIGSDWKDKKIEGIEWFKKQKDKKVIYLPYTKGVSTTEIKRQIIKNSYEIIRTELEREKNRYL